MQQQHRSDSPECESDGPLDISIPPLQPTLRLSFLYHLKQQVVGAEADAASEILDRVQLAVIKNDLVWLDCQLGTDGEALRIYKEIEALNDRVLKLSPSD
jgi:hypothetical protein